MFLTLQIGALLQLLARTSSDRPLSQDPISIVMAVLFPVFFALFIYVELKVASTAFASFSAYTTVRGDHCRRHRDRQLQHAVSPAVSRRGGCAMKAFA